MSGLIQNVYRKSEAPQGPRLFQGIRKTSHPESGPRYGPPRDGPVDARSFAAKGAQGDGPRLRPPVSLKKPGANNTRNPNAFGRHLANASASFARRPKSRFPKGKGKPRGKSDGQEPESEMDSGVKTYMLERAEKLRPKAARYEPEVCTLENLKETWPALPIGDEALSSTILDKMTWMSDRYIGSYETPPELATRVADGKRVLFKTEEEKNEVMEIVKKAAAEKADKLTEHKGSTVEPVDMSFQTLTEKERMNLIGSAVAGQYEPVNMSQTGVLARIRKNLYNNETYNIAQTAKFEAALSKLLPKQAPTKAAARAQ